MEDNARLRSQIVETLEGRPGWVVVAACGSVAEAMKVLPGARPEVVLLDIRLPGASGVDLIRPLRAALPEVRVMMLTAVEDGREIAIAIGLGALGYLIKSDRPSLVEGVEELLVGRVPVMSASVARRIWFLLEHLQIGVVAGNSPLSPRELDVLRLSGQAKQRKEIAAALGVSLNTVKNHLASIFKKLEVHSTPEALLKLRQSSGSDEPGE